MLHVVGWWLGQSVGWLVVWCEKVGEWTGGLFRGWLVVCVFVLFCFVLFCCFVGVLDRSVVGWLIRFTIVSRSCESAFCGVCHRRCHRSTSFAKIG